MVQPRHDRASVFLSTWESLFLAHTSLMKLLSSSQKKFDGCFPLLWTKKGKDMQNAEKGPSVLRGVHSLDQFVA